MIIKTDFIYTPKGKNRPLHIYLPDDYAKSGKRYPVTYFFDGHNLFFDTDATYGKCWGLKEFLDGWEEEMIVVGIECGHEGNERLSEYLPFRAAPGFFRQFKPLGGKTMDWIVNEIKPYIDNRYPTLPGRAHTGIAGSSMGGLMALYGGVHYNKWFSKAGCVSSAIGFCIRSVLKDIRLSELAPDTRFFLSWGTKEAHGLLRTDREDRSSRTCKWNRQVAALLREKGSQAELYCQVGGGHCEADWEKQLPIFMPWLWQK